MITDQELATNYMENYSTCRDGGMNHYESHRHALNVMNVYLDANEVPKAVANRLKASAMRIIDAKKDSGEFIVD